MVYFYCLVGHTREKCGERHCRIFETALISPVRICNLDRKLRSPHLVRIAMYFRSNFMEKCKYTFLESSHHPETKNQCFHLNEKLFGPPSWIAKWTPSNSCFDNISHAKQNRKSILVAMTTFLAVGKRMD